MNPKFLILYFIAGTLALILIIFQIFIEYPVLNFTGIILNLIMCLFFYYLAYKTYHEKKDRELM
ncbi:hypothetical protein [uncultured Mucilaginibacter sp.]|uniref:hypothetical protein n=1 Tax=uncultured Mucilaginibacter sp. TaxID=797541 RepID=UPI0025E4B896|nr:hypothetical protein [uncultured Mucilaginibacter sp.]